MTNKYLFFWNGIYSNWHPSKFEVGGVNFNCGEQYMMYVKAVTFNDMETALKILREELPKKQKALGREIKNFNSDKWDEVKYELVKNGLREKFVQNPKLKRELLNNQGCIFVEASPYDRIWGIGFEEDEAMDNIDEWGENLLGKIITELSNEL